jgi:hypothetical protein
MALPTPFYTVSYQAQPPLVRGVVQRPLSAAEFTEACELLLSQAQLHDCTFWLLDGRADASGERPLDVYEWLSDEFLPRVRRTLGRMPCLAFLALPSFWQTLQTQHYAPPSPMQHSPIFRANWFTTEAEALTWLSQFRPVPGEASV